MTESLFPGFETQVQTAPARGVYPEGVEVQRGASVSADGDYRFTLYRRWGSGQQLTYVMCNPSKADAADDDPTIRKCVGFAVRLGFEAINVVNLYAWRATKPSDLKLAGYPTGGQRNDDLLTEIGRHAEHGMPVVAAWGVHPQVARAAWFWGLRGMDQVKVLGFTKDGHPRHPLMLGYADAQLAQAGADAARQGLRKAAQ